MALVVAGCRFTIKSDRDAAQPGGDLAAAADLAAADLARALPDGAVPRAIGFPCSAPGECDSGACVDGYCCESLCDPADPANLCKACNVHGSEGRCVAAPAGTDPHQQCEPDPVASCGHDGLCDGNGACRHYAAGTPCGIAGCSGGSATGAPACDGNGSCVPGATMSCAPYVCTNTGACAKSCTPPDADAGCAPGATCIKGSCVPKGGPDQPRRP